jgi:hypothetical protein
VEREFADLRRPRGLRQFPVFGLARSRIQVGLLVLIHDGLQLLKARRLAAGPATGTPPPPAMRAAEGTSPEDPRLAAKAG